MRRRSRRWRTPNNGSKICRPCCNPKRNQLKLQRRKIAKQAQDNPEPKYSLIDRIGHLAGFIAELRDIADRADRERLSVLVDQLKIEYPEIYKETLEILEVSPSEALAHLVKRWPVLNAIKFFPNHLTLISMIQVEILNRRETT